MPTDGPPADHSPALSRRELLAVAAAILGAAGLPATGLAAEGPIDLARFGDLSFALTGYTPIDPTLTAAFREAFAPDLVRLSTLHDLVAETPAADLDKAVADAGLSDLAAALTEAWYTGTVTEAGEQRVVTYLNAFVWNAVGYTKPPSQCDTVFGAWAARPPGDF